MKRIFSQRAKGAALTRSKAAAEEAAISQGKAARLGWLIIVLGFGGFLTWAAFAPLDRGVAVSGVVTVSSNRQAIQHQSGGIVQQILVKEGDTVKAGQVLVRMNAVHAQAQAEMSRIQHIIARATEARLIAERDGKSAISFPAELQASQPDPRVAYHIALQEQLLLSRRGAQQAEIAALHESIAGLLAQAWGLEESRKSKQLELGYMKEQLDGIRDLARDGYVPRARLLELERAHARLASAISEDAGNIGRARRQVGELRLKITQRKQEYQREVQMQLAEAQKEAETLSSRLAALEFELANTEVRAPLDGTVVAMEVFTNGGVISAGFRMMDLVPSGDPLVVEAMVPVNLVDKVRADLPVALNFSALNRNTTPRVPAIVTRVSADRIVEERSGAPYYKMHIRMAPEAMELIRNLDIRPGMPVDLFVKTGERTLMSYLLKPVADHAAAALTEE